MYLKRLELHGFKSFASPTAFQFGTGATCIVGPNGSGKTNVAEAIRWVLGEQANRVIRARKTEDVIFSGSASRPALGMAEARLTLDNSDGWLPLEFEEVVVSRRAYRSGENEYYINQSRVRLKDVTDLFLKAQVGQNSYAFMGQGLVDQVLTMRPDERRGLIEEAADVRLHRTKLDQASNRLAATRENLERVGLLVAEIRPRLRQLERQADRASTYARLSGELTAALTALFGEQWQEAQEALAAARAACDQRQEEFARARSDTEAREEGLAALVTAIEERRGDIADREEAFRALQEHCLDLERQITLDEERREMMATRKSELDPEIQSLEQARQELAGLVAEQRARAEALEKDLAAAQAPDERLVEAERTEARLHELRRELTETERLAAQKKAHQTETETRARALTSQKERLSAELDALQRIRSEQLDPLETWARDFAIRRQRREQLSPSVDRGATELAGAERRLTELSSSVAERRQQVQKLDIEIESAQARLEAAEDTEAELPAPDAGVQAVLAAGGRVEGHEPGADSRIEGVVGMVGLLLRVQSGLERAVEAALADSLHAVVVETGEDALAAVELLISEDAGRATILPLKDYKATPPVNLLEERGVIGVASDLVQCDARYRPLVDSLLGHTIVAENLGIGKMLLRRGLGNVVTRDGILMRPSGSMTAGSARAVRRALTHQREVRELPAKLQRLRAARREAATALEQGAKELEETQRSRDESATELERLRSDLSTVDEALRRHRARLPGIAVRLSGLHARRREATRAYAEAERELSGLADEAERVRGEAEQAAARLPLLNKEIDELATAHAASAQARAEHSARLSALETEQAAVRRLLETQTASLARNEQELSSRRELLASLQRDLRAVEGRLGAARKELEEKARERETAEQELEPARRSVEQLESRQRAINEELVTARSHALAAERALLDAQTTVRLRTEELEALRERLDEEGFRPSEEGEIRQVANGEQPPEWLTVDTDSPVDTGSPVETSTPVETSSPEDAPPPVRGGADVDTVALKERVSELRGKIRRLGPVNEQAEEDYAENRERYDFLTGQLKDLTEAESSLMEAIAELERIIKERFSTTFSQVNKEFQRYFETFFGGGEAELVLTKTEEKALPGVDILAQPPRKRVRTINMLSGGERSLTAVALLFALLAAHPSPMCVLDEVDAALDEANVERFTAALRELAERTQFIIVTHNRRTIEMADMIYGVSMGEDSTSSVLSLRLSDVPVK